ncbi:ATPase family AAA domain-containing protein 5 [Podospora conica]|nr:ATPase family AAA domain-containing protein 5 [Schizothecium conicum]
MGSLAVLTMAADAARPEAVARKPLHPFFAPNHTAVNPKAPDVNDTPELDNIPKAPNDPPTADAANAQDAGDVAPIATNGRRNKRRKTNTDKDNDEAEKKPRANKRPRASTGGIAQHFAKPGKGADGADAKAEEEDAAPEPATTSSDALAPVVIPDHNEAQPPQQPPTSTTDAPAKATKVLRLNLKSGTIGSPPKPKQAPGGSTASRGTKVSPGRGKNAKSWIVTIRYGTDDESRARIGQKIADILTPPSVDALPATKPSTSSADEPDQLPAITQPPVPKDSKSTHPFFLGKAKKVQLEDPLPETKTSTAPASPEKAKMKIFRTNPCSPKKPRVDNPAVRMPQFGVKNMGPKVAGSKHPAWPWKDMTDARELDLVVEGARDLPPSFHLRKSKGHTVQIPLSESITEHMTKTLRIPKAIEDLRALNTDDFLPPPPELRLPIKHFESGRKLQARIIPELKGLLPPPKTKKGARNKPAAEPKFQPPPQLSRLFDSVVTGLSAFDTSQCETSNWAQKYAPTSAVEVLQSGEEQFLLRDWLQALTVQSVDKGVADSDKPEASSGKGAGPKKKRRKKLDGFIVSSDDEDYEFCPVSDEEPDAWGPNTGRGLVKKTVVRSTDLKKGKEGDKIANGVLISGPHGCGKTAAVYAVAKELGFEVFEINTSSRRSGKDVMQKIGDMTRNHLVRHNKTFAPAEDQEPVTDDEVAKDLKSGKQATMNAFFKPKAGAPKPKPKPKMKEQVKPTSSAPVPSKEAKKESSKNQRQSLILLEEADILYEEDKQFWLTVVGLMTQSKRPFIMTCNDETLVPISTMRLHGIFRLSPPPRELAVDRLLLVAANEGHALKRHAVELLYESRHEDLRAATMDLQFWCQLGVGDRRGGFEWFYLRWPKGIDLDENKDVVRVVSEDTYRAGMNWLGRDAIVEEGASPRLVEEELMAQSCEFWGLDIARWQDSGAFCSWAERASAEANTPARRRATLDAYDGLSDAMGAADILGTDLFAGFKEELLDATCPDLPAKTYDDFIVGPKHIDTPFVTHHDSDSACLAFTLKSLAKCNIRAQTAPAASDGAPELQPVNETQVIDFIRHNLASPVPGSWAINRLDFALAFDPLATSDFAPLQPTSYLDPSVFDRNMNLLVLDLAPFVRTIISYEAELQKQRLKLSSLISEGGGAAKGSKRMRTTRAALSALEGGSRSTIRGEKWFKAAINPILVARTAGAGWGSSVAGGSETTTSPPTVTSPPAVSEPEPSQSSCPVSPKEPAVKKASVKRGRGRPRKVVLQEESGDELGEA